MRAVRSINNNIAVCVDSAGNELIAMGKGIGYGKLPREIALEDVTQTFYNVSPKVLSGIEGIPEDVMVFSADLAERARDELSYQLSPNLAFTLAGGCPGRMLIMSGEGDSDAGSFVMGLLVGAAFAHNFSLASSATGIGAFGIPATIVGLVFCLLVGFAFRNRMA